MAEALIEEDPVPTRQAAGGRQEESATFEETLAEENRRVLRVSTVVGVTIFLLFNIEDRYFIPERANDFFVLRASACAANVLLALAASRIQWARWSTNIFWLWLLVWGGAIAAILPSTGEHLLSYVLGLCVVQSCAGGLPYWDLRRAWTNGVMILVFFEISMLYSDFSLSQSLIARGYLLTFLVVSLVMSGFRYHLRRSEFAARKESRERAAELAIALDQLKEVDKLKSEFFANISHELRTPLTLIIAPVEELLGSLQQSHERDVLKVVRRNASRLLRMIDDLLDLARLEAGGLRLQVRQFNLSETAERVSENAQQAAEAKGVALQFESRADDGEMYGDPHRIEIVLTNLISNAVKFTPEDGRIDIRAQSDENGAMVEVTDTGPGIPREAQAKVFERFYQVLGSERRRQGGAGIGLALAKELAELHGGSLTLESELGEGSTFRLFIPWGREHFESEITERRQVQHTEHPARRAEDKLASVPPPATGAMLQQVESRTPGEVILLDGGRRPKILIAEDEEDLREFMASTLSQDFEVRAAKDGAEALELLAEDRPDLVLTDIMMPNTSGLDLCRSIKTDPTLKQIPVILLTARGESETALEGFGVGADDFVAKPFHPQVLGARIRAHLMNRSLSMQLADQARLASAGTLAAGLAHEVKNPINAIVNAAKVLKQGHSNPAMNDKLLQVVIEGVERINSIVSVIEAHVRPADGEREAYCSVRDGIESTLSLLEHRLIDVTVHREIEVTDAVLAPARALNQVLLNLIDNALLAGASNLWIELKQVEERVAVAVADDGSGVPPDVVQRIFDPFFTTRQEGEGTGLGLHLSRRIARDCGGELRFEPRPGGGARFVMEMPAMERAA